MFLEREKEIKELKTKLSRFPFELNEGEKLISVIFKSIDQRMYSVICKNTDKFFIIESKLYEYNKEYSENEINFIANGNKINKYKSLEENNIHNNDIIIINIIDN